MNGEPYLKPDVDGGIIEIHGGNPVMDETLRNAVYISLFTAPGWYGNELNPVALGPGIEGAVRGNIGTKSLSDVEEAARQSLSWLKAKGYASSVDVKAFVKSLSLIELHITITEPDGSSSKLLFGLPWEKLKEEYN